MRAATSNVVTIAVGRRSGCLHFDPDDARRQAWNGKWPGEDDCERLDFFVNGDADFPDLESVVHRLRLGCRHRTLGAEAVSDGTLRKQSLFMPAVGQTPTPQRDLLPVLCAQARRDCRDIRSPFLGR